MVNIIWFTDEKCSLCQHKQHEGMNSGVSQSKNSTISQVVCAGALSCWKV